MKIAAVEKEILATLMKHPKSVSVLTGAGVDRVGFAVAGIGYVLPESQVWIDTEKIEGRIAFRDVCPVLASAENELIMTSSLEEFDGLVLRRFEDFTGEPVWVINDFLKHFQSPEFYQEKLNGPILVMETSAAEGTHVVGTLCPYKRND